jgi:AraC-like DNA-binding protein
VLIAGGSSLTDAAHGSGYADAAHLTRTFGRMFGAPPSWLAGEVRWRPTQNQQNQPVRSSAAAGPAATLDA